MATSNKNMFNSSYFIIKTDIKKKSATFCAKRNRTRETETCYLVKPQIVLKSTLKRVLRGENMLLTLFCFL